MNVRKLVIIGGSILAAILIIVGSVMVVADKTKDKNIKKNTISAVTKYLSNIESGEKEKAYEALAKSTKEWLTQSEFERFIEMYTMEDKVTFEIDEARQEKATEEVNSYLKQFYKYAEVSKDEKVLATKKALSERKFVYVPVKRTYMRNVNGKKSTVSDEMILALVEGDTSYKIYFEPQVFETQRMKLYFKKAHTITLEAMQNATDKVTLNENIGVVKKCITYADQGNPEYYHYNRIQVYSQIFKAYVGLLEGKYEVAISSLVNAESIALDTVDIIKIKQIASEIYLSQGLYSKAAETLKAAVDIDPSNDLLRSSYRAVNRLMIDKIESSLIRGWNQLKSSISDTNKENQREMEKQLKYIAMPDADAVIKVKEDLPDGYFLKGSIYYCMGDFSSAKKQLEIALEKTALDDVLFKTEVAQTLGLAKVGNKETMSLSSYLNTNPGQIRSLFIRETNINGILDAME